MFHAAQAALAYAGAAPPKTHSGIRSLFAQRLVRTGRLPASLSAALATAAELREKGDYDVYANVAEEEVVELVAQAAGFLAEVQGLG